MADSRRINTNIRDEEQKLPEEERPPFSLVAVILSSEFWPPLKEEKLELPEQIKEAMEAYSKKYEKLKVSESAWRGIWQKAQSLASVNCQGLPKESLIEQPSSVLKSLPLKY